MGPSPLSVVDVVGVWNTASVCVPYMLSGPSPSGCRFVAVASAAGSRGLFHLSAYNAAQHAVLGLVRGLAADLVATGVTAAAVSPGSTRTQMLSATAEMYGLDDVEQFATSHLVRRLIDPAEVAAAVAFCCSMEGMGCQRLCCLRRWRLLHMTGTLPHGFVVRLNRRVRQYDGGRTLVGGAPTRVIYLTEAATHILVDRVV